MSGRAGRRGIDERGMVMMMVDQKLDTLVGKNILKVRMYVHISIAAIKFTWLLMTMHAYTVHTCDWILENQPNCHISKCSGKTNAKNRNFIYINFITCMCSYIINLSPCNVSHRCVSSMWSYFTFLHPM